jgi:hypothetical protein
MADVTPFSYRVFLLRTWEEEPGHPGGQRFSLEDPSTGRRYGFAEAAELVRFLEDLRGQEGDNGDTGETSRCDAEETLAHRE